MQIKKFVGGVVSTNIYLVYKQGNDSAILIDPARCYNKIKDYCKEVGVSVEAVLITHGHFDHILEASLWQKDGAKIYIHADDADKLYSNKNLAYMVNANVEPCTADVLLQDGDKLSLAGLDIKVLHTPGHSVGCVCYIIDDAIFSGDTLFLGDYGRVDFPDGSFDDIKSSLKKLFAIAGDYRVFPGHDSQTTLARERMSNAILRSL